MVKEQKKKPEKTGNNQVKRDKEGKFIKGVSGNPNGKPLGAKSFSTIFDEAIRKIIKEKKINIKDPETEMVIKAIVEALKGNYPFFRDLMDRKYGAPAKQIDLTSGGEPMGIIFLPRRKQDEDKQLNEPQNNEENL